MVPAVEARSQPGRFCRCGPTLRRIVAVVEKRHMVGGVCVDTGTIPSKTFREAVIFFAGLVGRFDWRQAAWEETRPTVEPLLARVGAVMRRETEVIERQLRRNGIALLWGEASYEEA